MVTEKPRNHPHNTYSCYTLHVSTYTIFKLTAHHSNNYKDREVHLVHHVPEYWTHVSNLMFSLAFKDNVYGLSRV